MKLSADGRVLKQAQIRSGENSYYQVFVYTIYLDNVALIEYDEPHLRGTTQYVNADRLIWRCMCDSLSLFRFGCQCGYDEN